MPARSRVWSQGKGGAVNAGILMNVTERGGEQKGACLLYLLHLLNPERHKGQFTGVYI